MDLPPEMKAVSAKARAEGGRQILSVRRVRCGRTPEVLNVHDWLDVGGPTLVVGTAMGRKGNFTDIQPLLVRLTSQYGNITCEASWLLDGAWRRI